MRILSFAVLLVIILYSFGFGITLWKEKQKLGALAVFFLCLTIVVLPFFSIF
ncbi:hypothetical protein [Neobacillus rhizophilus]|uniref:Uncharacterized protein n=1 Tax=Neobacillus rhizophilus TaxID=2833579 RepID=A0A942YX03_9BACI|nr:hypothetical protein [Neobacillus rhizophilus]MBS4215532.1 hypothetical protein [Neobacillus rhizophilus]MBU8916572.1 hypothetical protein [Bacillus sp. FJAT-29953]